MATNDEVVLKLRLCVRGECRAIFFLCARCDRGQRYCSVTCRSQARLRQRRCANRRHQQSPEGRLDHRDRQRRYRRRRMRASVTDQGSLSITCPALSLREPLPARRVEAAAESGPGLRLRCWVCGRPGRYIDPFPPIPRRR